MTKEAFFKSNYFKVFAPVFIVAMAIELWQNGYAFGQWLYKVFH